MSNININLNKEHFDVVVIGGGPIGLSTAYNCAKAGKKVLVLEKSNFFNASGSSGDLVRMFRTMYTEDFMADLAHETIQLWKDLEKDSGETLIWMTGLLNFGNPDYGKGGPEGTLLDPIKNLDRLGMPYRKLNSQQIMEEYPFKNLPETYQGIFSPDNGNVNVPLVLRSIYNLCLNYGVKMVSHADVKKIKAHGDDAVDVRVEVTNIDDSTTTTYTIHTDKVAITCGAYSNHILKPSFNFELDLKIWEMVYSYFGCNPGPNSTLFKSMWFQFEENTDNDPKKSNLFYGFPSLPWGSPNCARIAVDTALRIVTDPNDRHAGVEPYDLTLTVNWIKEHLPGVDPTPLFCGSCLQTNVEDNMFVLDYVPQTNKNVVIFTAGWAMKFIPLIGKIIKENLFDGGSKYKGLEHFRIDRPGVIKTSPQVKTQPKLQKKCSSMHCKPVTPIASPLAHSSASQNVPSANINESNPPQKRETIRSLFAKQLLLNSMQKHRNTHSENPVDQASNSAPKIPHLSSMIQLKSSEIKTKSVDQLKIGIVGSGISGLYSAMILESLGINNYEILESNKDRIGGRVYTYKFSNEEYDYVDFGCMRFPIDVSTFERFLGDSDWSLFKKLEAKGLKVPTLKYHLSMKNNLLYYNGKRIFADNELKNDPLYFSDTHNGGEGTAIPDDYANVPYSKWLDDAYGQFLEDFNNDFDEGFNTLLESDQNSTRQYLSTKMNYPQDVITYLETLDTGTGLYDKAFSESIMDYFDFSGNDWLCIDGGSEVVVKNMIKSLNNKGAIKLGKQVTMMKRSLNKKYKNQSDANPYIATEGVKVYVQGEEKSRTYDHVINTASLAAVRKMDLDDCHLSHHKRVAIRKLGYDHSVKVALRFKYRWWEDSKLMQGKPCLGGKSSTDLPVRTIVYPSYGIGKKGVKGVLIVSYTWAQDASRIGSLVQPSTEKELVDLCLDNLAKVHNISKDFLVNELEDDGYKFWDWYQDPNTCGAFALYAPSEFTTLFPSITKPAAYGHLHFAGEATSVHHAWVIGSLSSAYRSVDHILKHEGLEEKRKELIQLWGEIEDVDDPSILEEQIQQNLPSTTTVSPKLRTFALAAKNNLKPRAPVVLKPKNFIKPAINPYASSIGGNF